MTTPADAMQGPQGSTVVSTDPLSAILIGVTRIEGDLKGALETLKRHDGAIESLQKTQADHGQQLVALRTQRAADEENQQRSGVDRSNVWQAAAALASIAAVVLAVLLAVRSS